MRAAGAAVRKGDFSAALLALLGPDALIRLAECHGGTRLYVPIQEDSALASEIGPEAAGKLAARYGRDYIRVPLARELRARHYRAQGLSNKEIAVRLGMTQGGIEQLFHAMPKKPIKGSGDPRQGDLFPVE